MSDERSFDPRYNPEFQRGYEPPVGDDGARETLRASRERVRPERMTAERVAPMPVAPAPEQTLSRTEALVPPSSLEDLFSADASETHDEPDAPPWRNPYLISLTVIGAVLTIAGVSLFRWAVTQMYSGQISSGSSADDAQSDWMWVQVSWGIAPLLAIAGVLTLIGVIFVLAVKWTPRQRNDDDTDVELEG